MGHGEQDNKNVFVSLSTASFDDDDDDDKSSVAPRVQELRERQMGELSSLWEGAADH